MCGVEWGRVPPRRNGVNSSSFPPSISTASLKSSNMVRSPPNVPLSSAGRPRRFCFMRTRVTKSITLSRVSRVCTASPPILLTTFLGRRSAARARACNWCSGCQTMSGKSAFGSRELMYGSGHSVIGSMEGMLVVTRRIRGTVLRIRSGGY